jgi:hypothetical protein
MFKEKWEAVKDHVSRNRTVYITVCACIVTAGLTYLVIRDDEEETTIEISADDSTNIINSAVEKLNIYNLAPGRPGKPVLHIESGNIYRSYRDAARALNVDETNLSHHLHGRQEHVHGHHFKDVEIKTPFSAKWKDYNKMLDKAVEEANRTGQLPA